MSQSWRWWRQCRANQIQARPQKPGPLWYRPLARPFGFGRLLEGHVEAVKTVRCDWTIDGRRSVANLVAAAALQAHGRNLRPSCAGAHIAPLGLYRLAFDFGGRHGLRTECGQNNRQNQYAAGEGLRHGMSSGVCFCAVANSPAYFSAVKIKCRVPQKC